MKQRKMQTKNRIKRIYNVYDENDNLIDTLNSPIEVFDKYKLASKTYIYISDNNQKLIKPNIKSKNKIRIDVVKEKIKVNDKFVLKKFSNVESLEDEIWKEIPTYPYYYASNKGRFKIIDSNNHEMLVNTFITKNKTKRPYRNIRLNKINSDGSIEEGIVFRTSRVLAKTFLDEELGLLYKEDKRDIDHIDNNPENECIENLRIITHSDNIRAAIYEQDRVVGREKKKCYSLNIRTDEIKEYSSTNELCRDIFGKNNNGYFSCYYRNKSLAKGKYLVGYDIEELKENRKKYEK